MKESGYKNYDDLPLFLNSGKTQRSGFGGERSRSGVNELSPSAEANDTELAATRAAAAMW